MAPRPEYSILKRRPHNYVWRTSYNSTPKLACRISILIFCADALCPIQSTFQVVQLPSVHGILDEDAALVRLEAVRLPSHATSDGQHAKHIGQSSSHVHRKERRPAVGIGNSESGPLQYHTKHLGNEGFALAVPGPVAFKRSRVTVYCCLTQCTRGSSRNVTVLPISISYTAGTFSLVSPKQCFCSTLMGTILRHPVPHEPVLVGEGMLMT